MIKKENIQITCSDGVQLQGILIIPDNPKAVVQFNGGTAAKKEFYLPFLEFLAEHNYICCLWDYRGSGDSAPENLADCDFAFLDYGLKDMPAVKSYLRSRYPDLPFMLFGHSAGGQQIGFVEELSDVTGMVNFAVSTGYLPNMPLGYKVLSYYFFFLFTPLSISLAGYLKAKKFGYMENLPKNVVLQWRNWCMKPNYFFDQTFYGKSVPTGNFQQLNFPIHTFWATDDPISNEKNLGNFWKHVKSSAGINFEKVTPHELGVKEIGHFGFFKKKMKDSLWLAGLSKLDEYLTNQSKQKREVLQ